MSDHQPPLNDKESAFVAISAEVRGLERSLTDLSTAIQTGRLQETEGLGAVARISRYSESIFKLLVQLDDENRAADIRNRVSQVWMEVDRLLRPTGLNFSQLLEKSKNVFAASGNNNESEPSEPIQQPIERYENREQRDNNEQEWFDVLSALEDRARGLAVEMRNLQKQIQDALPTRPGITAEELSKIMELLAEFAQLGGAFQAAELQYPNQANNFASSWQRINTLLSVFEKNLDRFSHLSVVTGQEQKSTPPQQEGWPPDFMESSRQFLATAQSEYLRIKGLIDPKTMLRPSDRVESDLRDQANAVITDFHSRKAQIASSISKLDRWIKIVQSDTSIPPTERFNREDEISALKTELQDYVRNMEQLEQSVWEKTLLFFSPDALTLYEAVKNYTEPTPPNVTMAGYAIMRAGVTDLIAQIDAVRSQEKRLSNGSTDKQNFLRAWLDSFTPELEKRKLAAFIFWRDHLTSIHPSFDVAVPGSMAERYQQAHAITDLSPFDSRRLQTTRSELEAALRQSRNEVAAAVTARQLPSEAEESNYHDHVKTIWADTEREIARWKGAIDQKEAYDHISGIEAQLQAIEKTLLVISIDDNQVKDRFGAIREEFKEKVEQNTLLPEQSKRELEIRIVQAEYKHVRMAYIERIEFVEGKNLGLGLALEQFGKVMDVRLIPRLDQLVGELARLSRPPGNATLAEHARYKADADDVKEDYRCRKYAHIAWARVWSNVIGNNESQGREPPTGLSDDNFPLDGTVISGLISHGVLSHEFGGGLVGEMNRIRVQTENFDRPGQIDNRNYQQSLFGFCMRTFDAVYQGRESCPGVTTRNIHTSYDVLVTYTYEKAKREYAAAHRGSAIPFTKHDVLLAWRLHSISTLNISYLAEASPTMPDNFYYMFNWVDYCIKYAFDQTNSFDPMQTLFVFGYGGANPLRFIYSPEQLEEVRHKLEGKGWMGRGDKADREAEHLWQLEGYTGFDALINAPLIKLENVAHDGTVKAPMFEPPLRAWVYRDGAGRPKRYKNADGSDGKMIRFDDLQTTTGERLYEEMPFQQLGMAYPEYYNQIGKNAMWFLTNVLKCSSEDFLKKMGSADFVKTLRNQVKYAMPYFTKVGADIREGTKRKRRNSSGVEVTQPVGETVMNSVVNQLIMAKCIMETDVLKPKFWNINQVEDYLQDLVRSTAIIPEVAEAIKLVVIEGRKWQMRQMDLLHKLQAQVESAAKMK